MCWLEDCKENFLRDLEINSSFSPASSRSGKRMFRSDDKVVKLVGGNVAAKD